VPATLQKSAFHIFSSLFTTILMTTEEVSYNHRSARIWIEKESHDPQRVWQWFHPVMDQGRRIIFDSACIISYSHPWTFALVTHKKSRHPRIKGEVGSFSLTTM
jgi:hypothetical protein